MSSNPTRTRISIFKQKNVLLIEKSFVGDSPSSTADLGRKKIIYKVSKDKANKILLTLYCVPFTVGTLGQECIQVIRKRPICSRVCICHLYNSGVFSHTISSVTQGTLVQNYLNLFKDFYP